MVEATSTQLSGGQWVGPAVRLQNGGQNGYLGIYYWNSGSPELVLDEERGELDGARQRVHFRAAGGRDATRAGGRGQHDLLPGEWRPAHRGSDGSFTGGAPGIMAYGNATADNWSGGTAGFQADYQSTDAQGIKSYDIISANDGYGPQILRCWLRRIPLPG